MAEWRRKAERGDPSYQAEAGWMKNRISELSRKAGASSAVAFVFLAMLYLEFFGLYASYKKERFIAALVLPPIAWWDAVSYWWQPAEWERDWDVRVQSLSRAVFYTHEDLAGDRMRTATQQLHEWVDAIPTERRAALRRDVEAWINESLSYMFNRIHDRELLPSDPARAALVSAQPGMQRELARFKALDQAGFLAELGVSMPLPQSIKDEEEARAGALQLIRLTVVTQLAEWFGS